MTVDLSTSSRNEMEKSTAYPPRLEPCHLPQYGFDGTAPFEELVNDNPFLFRVHTPHRSESLTSPTSPQRPYFLASSFRHSSTPDAPPETESHDYASISKHLDWTARAHSPYIRTSFSFAWAVHDAARRYKLGVKQDVEIAVIDARNEVLRKRAVVVTKVLDGIQGAERSSKKFTTRYRTASDSQLVLVHGYVPRDAIYASVSLRHLVPTLPSYFLVDPTSPVERSNAEKRDWPLGTSPTSLLYWTSERQLDCSRPTRKRTMSLTINPRSAIHNSYAIRSSSRPPLYSSNTSPLRPLSTAPATSLSFPRDPASLDSSDYQTLCRTLSDRFMHLSLAERMKESTAGAVRSALCFLGPWLYEEILRGGDDAQSTITSESGRGRMRKVLVELATTIARWPAPWWCGSVGSKIHNGIGDGIGIGLGGQPLGTGTPEHPEVESVIEGVVDVVVEFMNSRDGRFVRQLRELRELGERAYDDTNDTRESRESRDSTVIGVGGGGGLKRESICETCRRRSWVGHTRAGSWDGFGFGSETDVETDPWRGTDTDGSDTEVELDEQRVEDMLKVKKAIDDVRDTVVDIEDNGEALLEDEVRDDHAEFSESHETDDDDNTLIMNFTDLSEEDGHHTNAKDAVTVEEIDDLVYPPIEVQDDNEPPKGGQIPNGYDDIFESHETGDTLVVSSTDLLETGPQLVKDAELVERNEEPLQDNVEPEAGLRALWSRGRRWMEAYDFVVSTPECVKAEEQYVEGENGGHGMGEEPEEDITPTKENQEHRHDEKDAQQPFIQSAEESEMHFRALWNSIHRQLDSCTTRLILPPPLSTFTTDSDESDDVSDEENAVERIEEPVQDDSADRKYFEPEQMLEESSFHSTYKSRPASSASTHSLPFSTTSSSRFTTASDYSSSSKPIHEFISMASFGLTSFLCGVAFASLLFLSVPRRELARLT